MINIDTANIRNTIINWNEHEYRPSVLVQMFNESNTPEDTGRAPIRTDIDISTHRYDFQPMKPEEYGVIEYGEKGKTSINKCAMVEYMKGCKIVFEGLTPYMFDGFIYRRLPNSEVSRMMYKVPESCPNPPFLSRSAVDDMIAMLRATSTWADVEVDPEWDAEGRYEGTLVPFQNGIYNINTDELLPFTPNLFITHQLAAYYNPSITDHPVERIYRKIIPDPDTRRFFFEMVGYSLFNPHMAPPAIFLIYGPGNTGKSALQEAVTKAAGADNVSSLSIGQISQDFLTAELQGKLINICGETGSGQNRDISKVDGELLKRLSDGQVIKVQRKYKDPFDLVNTAKLWFVSNTLPDFGDTSSGLYRRLYIVPCRVEQRWEDQIYSIMQEEDAISWLMNMAVRGYRDFLDRGAKFEVSEEMRNEAVNYRNQEALMDFLEASLGTSDRNIVSDKLDGWMVKDLYADYKQYVDQTGGKPLSTRKFSEKIRNEFRMETEKVRGFQDNGAPTNRMMFIKAKVKT